MQSKVFKLKQKWLRVLSFAGLSVVGIVLFQNVTPALPSQVVDSIAPKIVSTHSAVFSKALLVEDQVSKAKPYNVVSFVVIRENIRCGDYDPTEDFGDRIASQAEQADEKF